jgi:pantothenate synthetase
LKGLQHGRDFRGRSIKAYSAAASRLCQNGANQKAELEDRITDIRRQLTDSQIDDVTVYDDNLKLQERIEELEAQIVDATE